MGEENRSLELDPTWSVAIVLTLFVSVSLLVEHSIHRLCHWLQTTNRKPLYEAIEKMKEELMLLGFISLLLTATSTSISNICINAKFYVGGAFAPCTKSEIDKDTHDPDSSRRLGEQHRNNCKDGYEPFVSYEGLEELHRFIFIMAITHIAYSCLTMLLALVKIHTWRAWEDEIHSEKREAFGEVVRELQARRQAMVVKFHLSHIFGRNKCFVLVVCFFRQFLGSVIRADYLALRMGFIMNHNLALKYDFHGYMVRSTEEEFHRIVGLSPPLWGFVVGFMLFNVKGSHLYFYISVIPILLVLVVGTKLQHIVETLSWESAAITGFFSGTRLQPRDDLFWFKKPELILSLLHFVLFQNSFELASYFWYWWQFGYNSCFIRNHLLVYSRVALGFTGQLLCSYSTLPLYALVTQMGTHYKAALISDRVRETLHGWNKSVKRRRRSGFNEEEASELRRGGGSGGNPERKLPRLITTRSRGSVGNEPSSGRGRTPLLKPSASVSSSSSIGFQEGIVRSMSYGEGRRTAE